jgi:hypothetical protein
VITLRIQGRYKRLRKNMDRKMKGLVEGKCHKKVKEDDGNNELGIEKEIVELKRG